MTQEAGILNDDLFLRPTDGQVLSFPIIVVGGSTAAYSAVLGALKAGGQVCLVMPQRVLGGQFTAQALPASDDAPLMAPKALLSPKFQDTRRLENGELFCISRSQRQFRDRQRQLQPVKSQIIDNPGGSWVSHFSVTPVMAAIACNEALVPYLQNAQLQIISQAEPVQVLLQESPHEYRRVTGVVFRDVQAGHSFTVKGDVVLEATDLGDLLELGNIESRVGQEARSETQEAILPEAAHPRCQQAFTFCAVIEYMAAGAGESIGEPMGYGIEPWLQPNEFTGIFWVNDEGYAFLHPSGIFRYRRLLRSFIDAQVRVGDVTVLNWGTSRLSANGPLGCGNDYTFGALVGVSRAERQGHLQRARDRAQAYLHFLQTKVVPDLRGRGDLTWTADGIALEPYIREARRGIALTTIRHEDVGEMFFPEAARSRSFDDSVGIGHYHYLDFHPNEAEGHVDLGTEGHGCLPFTIPLGALIPLRTEGLILSAKSIGTTHITNSAYRMHPVEWAIGEAGGHLAAFALKEGVNIRDVAKEVRLTRKFQGQLARFGIPLYWFNDVSHDDPDFEAIQVLAAAGIVRSENFRNLNFNPQGNVNRADAAIALVNILGLELLNPSTAAFVDVPAGHYAYQSIATLFSQGIVVGVGRRRFAPERAITHEQLAILIGKAQPDTLATLFADLPTDPQPLSRQELSRFLYRLLQIRFK
jgi:hypothetical protein